jgi:hypothetical protein
MSVDNRKWFVLLRDASRTLRVPLLGMLIGGARAQPEEKKTCRTPKSFQAKLNVPARIIQNDAMERLVSHERVYPRRTRAAVTSTSSIPRNEKSRVVQENSRLYA